MAHRKVVWLPVLIVVLILIGTASPLTLAKNPSPEELTEPVVVRLYVRDIDHLNAVAGELDIWESHPDDLYVIAYVRPAQIQWLPDLGYRVEIDPEKTALLAPDAPLDPRYYYFDEDYTNSNDRYMVDFMEDTSAAYPDIVEMLDVGDAWQGQSGLYLRDIWVLRITNEDPAYGPIEDKPVFYIHGGIHAREVAIPELAIRYIKYLTSGYDGLGGYGVAGRNLAGKPQVVAYVAITASATTASTEANTSLNRRKNMDNDGWLTDRLMGCGSDRNHSSCGAAAADQRHPCSDTYRGPARGSSPRPRLSRITL